MFWYYLSAIFLEFVEDLTRSTKNESLLHVSSFDVLATPDKDQQPFYGTTNCKV